MSDVTPPAPATPIPKSSGPNASSSDPTDSRDKWEWETKYAGKAKKQIWIEFAYLSIAFLGCFFLIFANWKGWLNSFFAVSGDSGVTLKKFIYFSISGMLGSVTFGIKYFYRVIARGYWHSDRIIWRLMSPFLGLSLAFMIGVMISAGALRTYQTLTTAGVLTIGFLTGYFADEAVGKMYELASVLFGKSSMSKGGDVK